MPASADPLTAATTQVLKPVLSAAGFSPLSRRAFVRLGGDVLQYLDLQLSAWGTREFAVNYTSLALFPPREHISLPTGGRLPRGKSPDGWWSSTSHEQALNSMSEVVHQLNHHAIPFFERTRTLEGLIDVLRGSGAPNAHTQFHLACCLARLARLPSAEVAAERAVELYEQWHAEMPEREWAMADGALASSLLAAIRSGAPDALLDEWRQSSLKTLKLVKQAR